MAGRRDERMEESGKTKVWQDDAEEAKAAEENAREMLPVAAGVRIVYENQG